MKKENEIARSYLEIAKDYVFDPSIFNNEPERVALVKYIINERLSQVDRTIIVLYADCQSYRKLGKRLGLSHQTVAREIHRIKNEILTIYNELKKQ